MRRFYNMFIGLIVAVLLAAILPMSLPQTVDAQDGVECPEGLVPHATDPDRCVEPGAEDAIDEVTDATDPVEDAEDGDDQSDSTDGDIDDGSNVGDIIDDDGSRDGDDDAMEEPDDEITGTIANLTLITNACPAVWDPAIRGIDESRAGCTATPGDELSYTVLYEGTEQLTTPAPATVDLASIGGDLPAGTWTIRENGGESDPYASCTATAADGTVNKTIVQSVPGGSLDVTLGEGDTLDCEWFSTRELVGLVGDGSGPISFTMSSRFCPFGLGYNGGVYWTTTQLDTYCQEAAAPVTYDLRQDLGGDARQYSVVSTLTTNAAKTPVDFLQGAAPPVGTGYYRIYGQPPATYRFTFGTCNVTDAAGATSVVKTTVSPEQGIDISPGIQVACEWFYDATTPQAGSLTGIDITAHVCAFGTTDTLKCTESVSDAIFIDYLRNDQLVGSSSFVNTPSMLNVSENGGAPNAGTWTLQLRGVPASWPAVRWYCQGLANVPETLNDIPYLSLTGGQIDGRTYRGAVSANQRMQCDVTLTKPVAVDSISADPRECPDGIDPASLAALDRSSQCTSSAAATFQMFINDQIVAQKNEGSVVMAPLTPGLLRIVTVPPAGTSLRVVSCDITNSGVPDQVQTIEPTIGADGTSITMDTKAGDTIACDWFFASLTPVEAETGTDPTPTPPPTPSPTPETPEDNDNISNNPPAATVGGGTSSGSSDDLTSGSQLPSTSADSSQVSSLQIQHWDCPESVNDQSAYEDLVFACTLSTDDSSWVIEGLQPGPIQITVGDDATSIVSCGSDGEGDNDTFPTFLPVENGAVTIAILPSSTVYCDWFVGP